MPELMVRIVFLKNYGIEVRFVTSDEPSAFAAAIDEKTKAIYVESIGNPKYNISPLSEIAKVHNYMHPQPVSVLDAETDLRSHMSTRSH
jgi:O-acetylhomoserine/O-acetylserine sulfhydrylase